jgi:hypothetical protein
MGHVDRQFHAAGGRGNLAEQETARDIVGDFGAADDLLWQAESGRLLSIGQIRILRSGRIGPIVEMAMASHAHPDAYARTSFDAPFARLARDAIAHGAVSGAEFGARTGVFGLRYHDPTADDQSQWDLWASRAEQAAMNAGLARGHAAAMLGALGELQDNIYKHSGRPETGVVAYAATAGAFEFVVADAGIGVLASLQQNPEFACLADAGQALRAAASDGASRLGRDSGHGYGIGQVFRALAGLHGELRFRSDDHALRIVGDSPSLTGQVEIAQKARLPGLAITVLCRTPGRANG